MKQEKFTCIPCGRVYTISECTRLDINNLTYVECPKCKSQDFYSDSLERIEVRDHPIV